MVTVASILYTVHYIVSFRPVDVHSLSDLPVKILTKCSQDFKLEDFWVSLFIWMSGV